MDQAHNPSPEADDSDLSEWINIAELCTDPDVLSTLANTAGDLPKALLDERCLSPIIPGGLEPSRTATSPRCSQSQGPPGKRQRTKDAHNGNKINGDTEFSVICFPSNPALPDGRKKKRRDFDQKRRLEVAQVRKEGACMRCKIRRISCGQGQPCKACLKTTSDLGHQICSREKLTKIRFSTMDINYIEVTTRLLDQELMEGTTHVSQPRKIEVSLDHMDAPRLDIEVQDYYTCSSGSGWLCCWVVMDPIDGRLELYREESSRYALTRLPTSEALVNWAENVTIHNETRVIGLHQALDSFIMKYAKSQHDLPMKSLLKDVHQLNCLAKIRMGLVHCLDQEGSSMPPSCTLHTQLSLLSKQASQVLEKAILSKLESVVFGSSGIGPTNGLALWASLWCLILMYRKLVRSYVAFGQFPCHVPKEYRGFPESKLQMGTNFYHYMVSIYAALFRTTTPLYTDFRVEENRQLLCNDDKLIEAFMNVRTESFYFQCEASSMTSPEDQVLRNLVVEREARLRPMSKPKR